MTTPRGAYWWGETTAVALVTAVVTAGLVTLGLMLWTWGQIILAHYFAPLVAEILAGAVALAVPSSVAVMILFRLVFRKVGP